MQSWTLNEVDVALIDLALIEDLGQPFCDLTTATLFPGKKQQTKAKIISKHPTPVVVCGLPIVQAILAKLGDPCHLHVYHQDGETLHPGDILYSFEGPVHVLLMAERTMLNFLQRLCGIATLTHQFVEKVKHTKLRILDTRKTTPGFRHLEKYAVCCGGGVNHRMGLYDAILVKDTHIDALGGMSKVLDYLPDNILQQTTVIIEVRNLEELKLVLNEGRHKVTRVLLDNMSFDLMQTCVKLCENIFPTEASGNISLENIRSIGECGVDFVSIGKLTHSAGSVDLSMKTL